MSLTSILIGGVEYISKIKLGVQFIERLDFELDSGILIIPFSYVEDEITPFTRVEMVIGDTTVEMFVLKDTVDIVGLSPKIYKHTISIIEPTKILEKYSCYSMTFTQPITNEWTRYTIKSYIERIRNNVPLEIESKWSATRYFDLSSDFDVLANYDMPETFLNKPKIREAIDMGLEKRDALVRGVFATTNPSKKLSLKIDYFNATRDLIDKYSNALTLSKTLDGENYYSEAENYIENGVNSIRSISAPNGVYSSMRSDQANITTDNMQMITRLPIDKIDAVFLYVKRTLTGSPFTVVWDEFNITDFVYEESLWKALPEPNSSAARNKGNCVYYTRGDNKIRGFGDDVAIWFGLGTQRIIVRLVTKCYAEASINIGSYTVSYNANDLLWHIDYFGQVDALLRMEKPDFTGFKSQMVTNQQSNQVDIEMLSSNMRNTIKKIGNSELSVRKRIKYWANRVKVGDYTSDGYIVTAIENSLYNDYIEQNIGLSKDYNKMSMFVGVNQQVRQLPIPKGGVNTYLQYSEYAIIDSVASTSNDSSIKIEFIRIITEALKNLTGESIYGNAIFFTSDVLSNYVYNEAEFAPANNTFKITFGFNSPISAGVRLIPPGETGNSTSRPLMETVRYTNQYGRFNLFSFKLSKFATYDYTPTLDLKQYANKLPMVADTDISSDTLIETENFGYLKDAGETLKMTYQIPLISKVNSIIVGTHFWKIIMGGQGSGKLWASTTETYNKNDNIKCKGSVLGDLENYFLITYDEIKAKIQFTTSLTGYESVGFGDVDGNLILGINTKIQVNNTFYINFKNKKE